VGAHRKCPECDGDEEGKDKGYEEEEEGLSFFAVSAATTRCTAYFRLSTFTHVHLVVPFVPQGGKRGSKRKESRGEEEGEAYNADSLSVSDNAQVYFAATKHKRRARVSVVGRLFRIPHPRNHSNFYACSQPNGSGWTRRRFHLHR
jgi:hypothetical protein